MVILLAVDDSPHARAALERVRDVSWPEKTRVMVLSIARPATGAYAEYYSPEAPYVEQVWEDRLRFHQELVTRSVAELSAAGLEASGQVLRGDPREAIVETARAEHVDLIVMGSHGRTGLAKLVLGSVATHVVTHAACDVLVVKLPRRGL